LIAGLFAGTATSADITQVAGDLHCDLVVVTPRDGAWSHDPFAGGGTYGLVDERADAWRIYKRLGAPQP
jgi:hypothetical protein